MNFFEDKTIIIICIYPKDDESFGHANGYIIMTEKKDEKYKLKAIEYIFSNSGRNYGIFRLLYCA